MRRYSITIMVDTTWVDFTHCPIDIAGQYGGSDQKRGIIYNGERYMLKFPDRIPDNKRNKWNSSYSNSVYSEKVCCDILRALGFSVQETLLGTVKQGAEIKPVVACKNFVPQNAVLLSFKTIANSLLPEKLDKIPKLTEIYAVLAQSSSYFSEQMCAVALCNYWNLFIMDALLGNFDRHGDNWGYLLQGQSLTCAPIYDCGSCLYPQVADESMQDILTHEDQIKTRIYDFPTAALMLPNGKKVNYAEFIQSYKNEDCTHALLRIFPYIDLQKINAVIDSEPITEIRKLFYKRMLYERYTRILLPAYTKLQ